MISPFRFLKKYVCVSVYFTSQLIIAENYYSNFKIIKMSKKDAIDQIKAGCILGLAWPLSMPIIFSFGTCGDDKKKYVDFTMFAYLTAVLILIIA